MKRSNWKPHGFPLLLLFLLGLGLLAAIPPARSLAVTWTAPQRLTKSNSYDYDPAVIQTQDLKVWVFWENAPNFPPPGPPPIPDIVYKTYDWSTWASLNGNLSAGGSTVQTVVSNPAQDILPAVAQMKNGTLLLSFSSDRSGNFDIYMKRYNPATGWSSESQMTTDPAREETSVLVAAQDGTLWLFWDRRTSSGAAVNIFYKTYVNGVWSGETALTNDPAPVLNRQPSAMQAQDGRIWVFWSQVQDATFNKIYLYYKIYNGATWSTAAKFTSSNYPDRHPEISQTGEGNLWVFWNREMPVGGQCFQEDIWYKTSENNGSTWSSDLRLTNDDAVSQCNTDLTPDDTSAVAVQLRDFKVWVFWQSNRDSEGWWDLYYASSNAFPIHDVAVTSASAGPALLRGGRPVTVNVTVENQGGYTETFTLNVVAANATTVTIGTRTLTLAAGAISSLTFTWDTSRVNPGRWKITASIPVVTGESAANQLDNSLVVGSVHFVPAGDVDMNGTVNIIDASTLALAFNTRPGDPAWNPAADLNADGAVDIIDAATMALWYGTSG